MPEFLIVNREEEIPERLRVEHLLWQKGLSTVAGVDEAGRGPLAGPVVAAAVVFPPYFFIPDVKDSKRLTAAKREKLFEIIIREAAGYGVGIVDNAEIDAINIQQATYKAMRMALGGLKLKPQYILFDGYELPEKLYPQEAIIKGDDLSFTIGAASIIAKVSRDRLMEKYHHQYPVYHLKDHKGYGTKLHRELILQHGPCPIHRKTFLKKLFSNPQD